MIHNDHMKSRLIAFLRQLQNTKTALAKWSRFRNVKFFNTMILTSLLPAFPTVQPSSKKHVEIHLTSQIDQPMKSQRLRNHPVQKNVQGWFAAVKSTYVPTPGRLSIKFAGQVCQQRKQCSKILLMCRVIKPTFYIHTPCTRSCVQWIPIVIYSSMRRTWFSAFFFSIQVSFRNEEWNV